VRRAASFDLFSDFCVPHSQVEVAVVLHEVHDVDEINFSFKAGAYTRSPFSST